MAILSQLFSPDPICPSVALPSPRLLCTVPKGTPRVDGAAGPLAAVQVLEEPVPSAHGEEAVLEAPRGSQATLSQPKLP